jgi:nicotinamidase-related amidase
VGGVRLGAELLLASEFQEIAPSEWIMYKPRWDAFHATPLDRFLRKIKVTTVVVVGCNFPNCPRAAVYGASIRDYRTVLIADAVSGVYDRGLTELNAIGISTPTAEQYEALLAGSPRDGQPGEAAGLPI